MNGLLAAVLVASSTASAAGSLPVDEPSTTLAQADAEAGAELEWEDADEPAAAGFSTATLDDPLVYTCVDCQELPRRNPFFGVTQPSIKAAIFVGLFLLVYLLAAGLFRATIRNGASIASSFVFSMVLIVLCTFVGAWMAFSEYTWEPCWCGQHAADVDVLRISAGESLRAINWTWWAVGFGAVALLLIVIKLMVSRPAAAER